MLRRKLDYEGFKQTMQNRPVQATIGDLDSQLRHHRGRNVHSTMAAVMMLGGMRDELDSQKHPLRKMADLEKVYNRYDQCMGMLHKAYLAGVIHIDEKE